MVMELEQVGTVESARPRQSGPWRWTVPMYEQVAATGVFDGRRVELIDGEIVAMMPMGVPHIDGTTNLTYALIDNLPRSLRVLVQMPLTLSQSSQPEPDVAVVEASTRGQRPTTAHLVVEVSDSTLRDDRTTKASLYASAQIAEYWILDVNARTMEVLREPMEDAASLLGWRYGQTQVLREDALVSPLCAPEVELSVRAMLP